MGSAGRRRVEAVVQTLATLGSHGDSLAEVAHDARNMVTALGLYCDLLDEPGVLAVPFAHYSNELRLVAAASRRLVEKLVALDAQAAGEAFEDSLGHGQEMLPSAGWPADGLPDSGLPRSLGQPGAEMGDETVLGHGRRWESIFAEPIANLAAELLANRNLLAALAGPGIAVTVDTAGGARPVRLTAEDLTRLMVNMVRNAAEAMPAGGRIHIHLAERQDQANCWLVLAIEDNGPGIPEDLLSRIFDSGFTTHPRNIASRGGWPAAHRGLGLAITRSIVDAAGGRITAFNRSGTNATGARFEIELPVRPVEARA